MSVFNLPINIFSNWFFIYSRRFDQQIDCQEIKNKWDKRSKQSRYGFELTTSFYAAVMNCMFYSSHKLSRWTDATRLFSNTRWYVNCYKNSYWFYQVILYLDQCNCLISVDWPERKIMAMKTGITYMLLTLLNKGKHFC